MFQPDIQIIYSGIFAAALGALINFINCVIRHHMKGQSGKQYFFSGFIASLVLAPICFTKPYRKMIVFFVLSLAFDCIFKLMFKAREKKIVNKF